jgi:tricorn protease
MFRYTKTGTLVGKRTWGGLVGVSQYPLLMDGGNVTAPNFGFFSPKGDWEIENHGVAPDVEVDLDPKDIHEGHDPQLERAVAVAMKDMEKYSYPVPKRPAFPNYQNPKAPGTTGGAGNGARQ